MGDEGHSGGPGLRLQVISDNGSEIGARSSLWMTREAAAGLVLGLRVWRSGSRGWASEELSSVEGHQGILPDCHGRQAVTFVV